jgi:hypothetical protein
MMHPVQDCKCAGTYIRRTLANISQQVKKLFPSPAHTEYGMGGIAVLEKCKGEKRKIPMANNKDENELHVSG